MKVNTVSNMMNYINGMYVYVSLVIGSLLKDISNLFKTKKTKKDKKNVKK